jgi:hypothetical protein
MKAFGLGLVVSLLLTQAASALPIPYGALQAPGAGGFHVFEKHVAGYSNIYVDPTGHATAWALFTSEKKLDGSRDLGVIVTVLAGKETLFAKRFSVRVADAFFHGGHVRERREQKFSLTPTQWKSVTAVTFKFDAPMPKELCDLFNKKYAEGNNLFDPQITGCR